MRLTAAVLLLGVTAAPALSQALPGAAPLPTSPFLGGVPSGTATATTLTLSIGEIVNRALEHNLGVLLAEEGIEHARGTRRVALSQLLPNVSGRVAELRQKTNLEAFGFPLGNDLPRVVGPFNVFDARVFVSQSLFDLQALHDVRAERHRLEAERFAYQDARDLVVLVAARLYLQVLAAEARAESARAQLDTARALYSQAQSLRESGVIAGLDVVRAEVRLSTEQQRVTGTASDVQKAKLQLARVIGLPIGQPFAVSGVLPDIPAAQLTLEEALAQAYRQRPDYLAAQEQVKAAESARKAAAGELLPSFRVTADYGAIGLTAGSALATFNVTGSVTVPIFQGGRAQGHALEAGAALRQRRAEAEDLRAEIYYDVQTAFLDLQSIGEGLRTSTRSRELASLQLTQARDRFAAGVASNVEVIQAQEAVALASEQYISAFYGLNLSKAALARAVGDAEDAVRGYLGGSN